jgi:hypothetical protein
MQRYVSLNRVFLLCFVLLLAIVSCTNDDKDKKSAEPASTSKETASPLVAGYLDTLIIDRQAFDSVQNGSKIVFSFVFTSTDKPTLGGWILKGNDFDTDPNWVLTNSNPSTVNYSNGIYFGNVVLQPQEFNKIKSALSNHKFIVFAPYLDGKHIGYKIFLSPTTFIADKTVAAVADANPSPPKTY